MSDPTHEAIVVEAPPTSAALDRTDREILHPLVRAATNRDGELDAATLEKLMDLQERHEKNQAKKAYARALVALKAELPAVIGQDGTVDYQPRGKDRVFYTHATLAGAYEAVTPHLTKHGFALTHNPSVSENGEVIVTCRLLHSEGHSDEATVKAGADKTGGKNPAQGIASTITYLRRYTALALLGIATADMVEPEPPEPDPDHVDPQRNIAAMRALADEGIPKAEAEGHVEKPVNEWTAADLEALRELLRSKRADTPAPAAPTDDGGELSPEEEAAMEAHFAEQNGGES